ncbi:polysaccharide deacetylase [Clostridia bacterium]|nr:polysaccharide deacetylase [Clostridia bacterium]
MWNNKLKAVTFSYDDGVNSDIKLAELFNKYNLKCTFNVNSGLIGDNGRWKHKDFDVYHLDAQTLKEAYKGHEVAAHGVFHKRLAELSPAEAFAEMKDDADSIAKVFGERPIGMAYAYGSVNETAEKAVADAGLKYGRGVRSSRSFSIPPRLINFCPTAHHDDTQIFELAEKFAALTPESPALFYIWGHSYELDGNKNWDKFERLLELLAGRDDIFYGTNKEVLL